MSDTSSEGATPVPAAIRRKRLLWFGGGIAVVACGWGLYTLFSGSDLRSTDNAYVGGHIVQVTPQVAGTVTRVLADNTDLVPAGTPLVEIDPADARVELAAAEAELAQAVRNVRGLFAADARYGAEITVAQAGLDKARADWRERKAIAASGAVTGEEVRHAGDAVRTAEASLASARQARIEALAQISGSSLASHPGVRAAAERVRAAALTVERSHILAPASGMIAQRSIQLGHRAAPGEALMAVVPLDRLWIDANFKEVQLKGICPGQPATVTADVYGRSVVYHGRVVGMEAGTGAAFALLPPQNATGNWIKVVQRVPVRIALDPVELARKPLRIGMSTEVTIDAGHCDRRAAPRRTAQVGGTDIYDAQAKAADRRVAAVIAANIDAR
ncbi:MAG: efflux RND transporter periplasmic adaptor subunit [Sphingopyxis sp.]|nr:efflux RND transporter periplasmic adaptor subunit [Sphingopyxis sp.]